MGKLLYAMIGVGVLIAVLAYAEYSLTVEKVSENTNNGKIQIRASFFPYYEFTKNIAGNRADVLQFIPHGVETHGWEPSVKKIQSLDQVDAFVYNSLESESYVGRIMDSPVSDGITFIDASNGIIDLRHDHGHDFDADPHIWLDPILVKKQVENIKNNLIKIDPDNSIYYAENAENYIMQLDTLHEKINTSLSSCSERKIMSFHNAFNYFAQRYDLDVYSLGGLGHESDFSISEMKKFVDHARDNNIKAIFTEDLDDLKLVNAMAIEADVEILHLDPLETITTQNASDEITYLDKMEQNVQVLTEVLKCQ